MDTGRQLFEGAATGWRQGVYDDIKSTFRAPIVNWIWRTLMANDPRLTRYLWGQVKPVFETRSFGRCSIRYRDAVLSTVETTFELPAVRRTEIDVSPAEFRELRGQLATFDIVGPRLAVLFDVVHRGLAGESLGRDPPADRAATAPLPDWLDAERGRSPTMVDADDIPTSIGETVSAIREYHGFEAALPSIYRCLAQWPKLLESLWSEAEPILESTAFDRACAAANGTVEGYVDDLAYTPRLAPDDLRRVGLSDDRVDAVVDLFENFRHGPVETVLPALHLWGAAVAVTGDRGG